MKTKKSAQELLLANFPNKSFTEIKSIAKENIRNWQIEIWALKDNISNLERIISKMEFLINQENDWISLVEFLENEEKGNSNEEIQYAQYC